MADFAQLLIQSESTAARRQIPFVLLDGSGNEVTGATFTGSEIQISKNGGAYANFAGSVTEVGLGLYYYNATSVELDTLGFLDMRVAEGANPILRVQCQIVKTDIYETAADVWGITLENTFTAQDLMKVMAAALCGVLSGAATTNVIIKAANDSGTTRIDATVDADGNRSVVTLTP